MKFTLHIDELKDEEIIIHAHRRSALTDRIEALVREQSGADRIACWDGDEIKLLSTDEIECVTVLDGKTFAIDSHGKHLRVKQRLYELEECLPGCFIRINKSTIANEKHILRFSASFSGAVDAVFRCGWREYVSRRCFAEIRRRYHV